MSLKHFDLRNARILQKIFRKWHYVIFKYAFDLNPNCNLSVDNVTIDIV